MHEEGCEAPLMVSAALQHCIMRLPSTNVSRQWLRRGPRNAALICPSMGKPLANFTETPRLQPRRLADNHFHSNLSIGLKAEVRFQMIKNEFECLHVPRFLEPDVVQFTEAIDATHGIYERRCVRRKRGESP